MKACSPGRAAAVMLTAALLWSTSAGAAGHANNFGDKGQLILTADRLLPIFSFNYATTTTTNNGLDTTNSESGSGISLLLGRNLAADDIGVNVHTLPRIAADFTIIEHLTLGAGIPIGFGLGGTRKTETQPVNGVKTTSSTDAPSATAFGIAPRVGYIIPLGDILAFWPRAGFGLYSVSSKIDENVNNDPNNIRTVSTTQTYFSLDLDPQLAIVPLEHFFFHIGPIINIPLTGSQTVKSTNGATTVSTSNDLTLFNFGISAGLAGWFNL